MYRKNDALIDIFRDGEKLWMCNTVYMSLWSCKLQTLPIWFSNLTSELNILLVRSPSFSAYLQFSNLHLKKPAFSNFVSQGPNDRFIGFRVTFSWLHHSSSCLETGLESGLRNHGTGLMTIGTHQQTVGQSKKFNHRQFESHPNGRPLKPCLMKKLCMVTSITSVTKRFNLLLGVGERDLLVWILLPSPLVYSHVMVLVSMG